MLQQTLLVCSQCARGFEAGDLVQIAGDWVCAQCKPAFLNRVMAGGAAYPARHYGGFWIRFGARVLDMFAMWLVQTPLMFLIAGTVIVPFGTPPTRVQGAAFALFILLGWILPFIYEAVMLRYFGATLGKMACGLKVIRADGSALGWGISIGRYFMYVVSGMTLLIGYLMAAFDAQKRALHDRVCDTRVVYKKAA